MMALIHYLLQAGESADSETFVRELAQRVAQHGDALRTIAQQLGQNGIEKDKLEVAPSLLKIGMPIESVQEAIGLSEDDLAQIRH